MWHCCLYRHQRRLAGAYQGARPCNTNQRRQNTVGAHTSLRQDFIFQITGETMIKVGDLVRAIDGRVWWVGRGPWLVIQIDSCGWSCQAIQGSRKEWFDINHLEVVTHD